MDPAALLAALLVIDNVLRHEPPAPPHSPPIVRELLAAPSDADGETLVRDFAPAALAGIDAPRRGVPRPFARLLEEYLVELAEAQKALRFATGRQALDEDPILRRLVEGLSSADQLLRLADAVDAPALDAASSRFIDATLRFAHAAREAADFPREALRFDSPAGVVSIGTAGNDRHGPAALIVDPGGDDAYERVPATRGSVSVIVDFGGDDRYTGSDVVVRGLSAIVDFSGNDRYEMGAGLGAALGGASLLVDYAGDDSYEAKYFGQGAAAFGSGILVDVAGNDRYRLQAWGQGFGAAGGAGLLWDRAGNDAYFAAGEADPFERGAGLSGAQGAAFGFRPMLGGGVGILRDDAGDDAYEAQMFAQGLGYFYALGFLWDGGGNDRYRAVRYAQGNGVHRAVGILRDESGDDRYALSFGVGQGMGLDLAQGLLVDRAGDDEYRGGLLVQGAATANGLGFLEDRDGRNRFHIGEDPHASSPLPRSWGHAEWYGGLPSVGLLDLRGSRPVFLHAGKPSPGPADSPRVDEAVRAPQTAGAPPQGEALEKLEKHPSCEARAAALKARGTLAAAQAALRSSCWRLQAAALAELERLGAKPDPAVVLPAFLR